MAKSNLRFDDRGWEDADFPILCEVCLGDNPYVRMLRAPHSGVCKTCERPFTVFRWKPGRDARFKKTEICQTCAKLKNVCQTCILDLQYGLPVEVRDSVLSGEKQDIPRSDVHKEYFAQQAEREIAAGTDPAEAFDKVHKHEILSRLARKRPYYKRNRAKICSFFVRGECNRGDECPFRHEMPEDNGLQDQNLKDRYYGVNDPVAKKMMTRANEKPARPSDTDVKSIFLGGVDALLQEGDVRGSHIRLDWAKPRKNQPRQGGYAPPPMPQASYATPPPGMYGAAAYGHAAPPPGLPPFMYGQPMAMYPSMDPARMGAAPAGPPPPAPPRRGHATAAPTPPPLS